MSALIYPPARLDINHFASPEQIAAVRRPLNQAALLPASFYADPQSYAFDVEKLFMRHWLPVARTSELPEPGSYFAREMFGEPILLTRLDWDIRDVNDHDLIWRMMVPAQSTQIENFEEKKQELYGYVKQVWDEDVFACAGVAKGASSRFTTQGRLCPQEKSLYQLHNWFVDQYER